MRYEWILTGQEIDKTLDLGYIRVAGLHRECKPAVLFDPPNFRPRTMTHVCMYVCMSVCTSVCTYVSTYVCILMYRKTVHKHRHTSAILIGQMLILLSTTRSHSARGSYLLGHN